ncbi:hypothetical protein R9C00_02315 [Flammeovirgaceae bacterium SG7u.111]|nr:hypothetical protein [Flammeovirgaceae bacterium SG7u.132]WPO36275.1 hypothetical protein R9C00_02315 [Flammeovirgaceae bacterium SG7u.111]
MNIIRLGSVLPLLLVGTIVFAQPKSKETREKLNQYKEQYIRETLALTDEDAAKFFPIYNTYEEEKRTNRMKLNKLKRGFMAKSDEQLTADLSTMMAVKEEELAIEKKFLDKFMETLTPRQVAALYYAETQFRKKLLEKYGQGN